MRRSSNERSLNTISAATSHDPAGRTKAKIVYDALNEQRERGSLTAMGLNRMDGPSSYDNKIGPTLAKNAGSSSNPYLAGNVRRIRAARTYANNSISSSIAGTAENTMINTNLLVPQSSQVGGDYAMDIKPTTASLHTIEANMAASNARNNIQHVKRSSKEVIQTLTHNSRA